MGALIPLALQAAPWLIKLITGSSAAADVTQQVANVAAAVTGENDPDKAAAVLQADQAKMTEFGVQLEAKKNEFYQLVTDRLVAEQGEVNAATLHELPEAMRAKVAWLRMTTRPWTVRWCVAALVWPPLGVIGADAILQTLNVMAAGLGWVSSLPIIKDGAVAGYQVVALHFGLIGPTLLDSGSGFTTLYSWFAPSATSIVIGYMGLRQIDKAQERGTTVSDAASSVAGVVKKLFGR